VLDEGEIVIELREGSRDVVVSRSGSDQHPQSTASFDAPIVLSQTEIETVGLSDDGRLALIDGFVANAGQLRSQEAAAVNSVKAAFKEIQSLEAEIASLTEGAANEALVHQQLKALEVERAKLQIGLGASSEKQKNSDVLAARLADLSVEDQSLAQFQRDVGNWVLGLETLELDHCLPDPEDGEPDPLAQLRPAFMEGLRHVKAASRSFNQAASLADQRRQSISVERSTVEKNARALRAELDQLMQGAGQIARQMSALQSTLAQLQARSKTVAERRTKLAALRKRRDEKIVALSELRDARYQRRALVSSQLNAALGPHISVQVARAARYGEYEAALVGGLRGSGLRYADVVPRIVERLSPVELLQYVDTADFTTVAKILEVAPDRAARLVGHLRDHGLAEVATANVEDDVHLSLLDGVGYKGISSLSAGQRCTVVLSIVMQHSERTLVIDQPEDHLDNAFIANTVIKALRGRKSGGQIVLSTHNANIPVLGEADLVVELTSDGRNGFVQVCRPLQHPEAVAAITSVMEGGVEAFAARAAFYAKNSHD
jgi:prefoldin subunit 5